MRLIPLSEQQASFVEVELLGRYLDDDDQQVRDVMEVVLDHFERSRGRSLAVPDAVMLRDLTLEVINAIDDAIEDYRRGDEDALRWIGGVDDAREARGIHRSGEAIWKRLSALASRS
jgi:hypothetical protein